MKTAKKQRKTIEWERLEIFSKKLEISRDKMQIDCKLKLKVKKREMPLYHEVEESDTAEILRYIPTQMRM